MNNENNICHLTLTRSADTMLCGGYTLKTLISEYFKNNDIDTNKIQTNTVPSIANMKLIELNKFNDVDKFIYPWDLIIKNQEIIEDNLVYKIEKGNYNEIEKGVYIGKEVKISHNVNFKNTENSVIVIDNYSQIKDFVVIKAPCYIGCNTAVNAFTSIEESSIGDVCKIGGEIEGSIISNYSNKQHYGFLGHAYVGEWVNIGAGTSSL